MNGRHLRGSVWLAAKRISSPSWTFCTCERHYRCKRRKSECFASSKHSSRNVAPRFRALSRQFCLMLAYFILFAGATSLPAIRHPAYKSILWWRCRWRRRRRRRKWQSSKKAKHVFRRRPARYEMWMTISTTTMRGPRENREKNVCHKFPYSGRTWWVN